MKRPQAPDMTTDEALMLADDISITARAGRNETAALVLLAAEVRRQHAELERLQEMLEASRRDAQRAAVEAGRLAEQRLAGRIEAAEEERRWLTGAVAEVVE